MDDYKDDHRAAVMALSVMLHEAQGVLDTERGRRIDISGEVARVRAVLERQRDRIADLECLLSEAMCWLDAPDEQ